MVNDECISIALELAKKVMYIDSHILFQEDPCLHLFQEAEETQNRHPKKETKYIQVLIQFTIIVILF